VPFYTGGWWVLDFRRPSAGGRSERLRAGGRLGGARPPVGPTGNV